MLQKRRLIILQFPFVFFLFLQHICKALFTHLKRVPYAGCLEKLNKTAINSLFPFVVLRDRGCVYVYFITQVAGKQNIKKLCIKVYFSSRLELRSSLTLERNEV